MNKYFLAVGALAMFSTACVKTTTCDSGDSVCDTADTTDTTDTNEGCATYTGAFSMAVDAGACDAPDSVPDYPFDFNCDSATNDYWFDIYTIGWASRVELYMDQESGQPWTEYHNSDDLVGNNDSFEEYSADGYWDHFYLYLSNSGSIPEVQSDPTKTLYVCGDGRIATLGFMAIATSETDSETVDCDAFGNATITALFDTTNCTAPDWI